MNPNPHVQVRVDLERIRQNVREIGARSGVPVIAVVKADGYGLGAREVAGAIGELVEAFYVFDAREAAQYELHALTGKRAIALLAESDDPQEYIVHRVNPCVWTVERALALRTARPIVSVDTGQQRFACPAEMVAEVLNAGEIGEAMTHASTPTQAAAFDAATRGMGLFRHAAGSKLLDDPAARFDAVRPGLAIYRGAARVSARLVEARDGNGPAGYSGFVCPRFGVIRCGYSNRFRSGGPCVVNGQRRRVLEVGMQSAFIELGPRDRCGDEVVLLGDDLTEGDVAAAWGTTPQEAMLRLCTAGFRSHV